MKLFKGHITLELFTAVNSQENEKATKILAHEGLSSEFLDELKSFVEAKGYYIQSIAADLKSTGNATTQQVKIIDETVERAKYNDDFIRGKGINTRIQI